MANEMNAVETTEMEEMATVESGVEETQKKRKFDVEKTVDFIVNKRVEERLDDLRKLGGFDEGMLKRIAKQLKIDIKKQVQEERETERKAKTENTDKAKEVFENDRNVIVEALVDLDIDGDIKLALMNFVNTKLENSFLRILGLIK